MKKIKCKDCQAARETQGLWRFYNPLCLHCGARIIQAIQRLQITNEDKKARCRAQLADWMRYGHSEDTLRELAGSKTLAVRG